MTARKKYALFIGFGILIQIICMFAALVSMPLLTAVQKPLPLWFIGLFPYWALLQFFECPDEVVTVVGIFSLFQMPIYATSIAVALENPLKGRKLPALLFLVHIALVAVAIAMRYRR